MAISSPHMKFQFFLIDTMVSKLKSFLIGQVVVVVGTVVVEHSLPCHNRPS